MLEPPLRILLVATEKADFRLIHGLLDATGGKAHFEWARSFEAGFAALAQDRYDVCLADSHLGSRSGLELVAAAAALAEPPPIILLTAAVQPEDETAAIAAGAADNLVKSDLTPAALDRSMRYALQRRRDAENLLLRQRAATLFAADRRKDEVLALLAHELRNPLTAIRNAAQVLRREGVAGSRGRALETVDRQVRHLARLVDDLVDISRLELGKVELRLEPLDLAAVVREVLEDFAAPAAARGLRLTAEGLDEPIPLLGDSTRLTQVVANLLSNAVKFAPAGGEVTIALETDASHSRLRVGNTGHVLTQALLSTMFEPWVQGEAEPERGRGGLGLGLALVRGLSELHGGSVSVRQVGPHDGVEFTVVLPTHQAAAFVSGQAPARAEPGLYLLLVEDHHDVAASLRDLLEAAGHRAVVASEGPSALLMARERPPDAVLCDLGLPGMSGFEVAVALRAAEATRSIPLIALSGYAQPADIRRSREAGFDRHLVKPVGLDELLQTLGETTAGGTRRPRGS
jgi:signal transduction histidine kinase